MKNYYNIITMEQCYYSIVIIWFRKQKYKFIQYIKKIIPDIVPGLNKIKGKQT